MKRMFFLLLFCSTIYAQDLYELSLYGGGGYSALKYNTTLGKQSGEFDGLFGLNYTYFFLPGLGLGMGLEIAFYDANFSLDTLNMRYMARDKEENVDFEFRNTLSGYKETQNLTMLQLPIMLQLQAGSKRKYYAAAGVKLGIPLVGERNISADVVNSGYYEEENYEYKNQGFRGFGTFKDTKSESSESFKFALLAAAEMGVKWRLEDGLHLYTGAYFDYGLNNIIKQQKLNKMQRVVEYNSDNPPDFKLPGIFNSQWIEKNAPRTFTDRVVPMAIGFKVRLAFGQYPDYFAKKVEAEQAEVDAERNEEKEKLQLELELARVKVSEQPQIDREAERLAIAERLLLEARLAYEKSQREQKVVAVSSYEATRLAAEKTQLEREVARIISEKNSTQPLPPPVSEQKIEQTVTPLTAPQTDSVTPQAPAAPVTPAPATQQTGDYAVQVAVVLDEARAQSITDSLKQGGFNAYYKKVSNPGKLTGVYYRVRVGYFNSVQESENFAKTRLKSISDWWVDRTANDTKGHFTP